MTPPLESPFRPEELVRRISEIDLTNLRRRSGTISELPHRYTQQELLALRPEKEKSDVQITVNEIGETPPALTVPPPTPDHAPGTPVDGEPLGEVKQAIEQPVEELKKKKKKRSGGKSKNKQPPPTGFEEFYADPPITPDEHDEESDLYAAARPFHERMQTCIQRYRKKRNLDSVRSNILTKYFMLGGIEASTTKSFTGGLDKETLENATAQEIAAIQATDFIREGSKTGKYYDPSHPEDWVVDFEGVAKGFLSYTAPRRLAMDNEKDIKQICAVIRNFLNYVLAHGVCPEYTTDILAARKVCELAEKELWEIVQLVQMLPGDFNVAASTLYGGRYAGIYVGDQAWAVNDDARGFVAVDQGFSVLEAERIVKTAIAFAGSNDMFLQAMEPDIKIVKTETKKYEVVGIERASIKTIEEYSRVHGVGSRAAYIKPLGVFHVKDWEGPGLEEEDMTDDEDSEHSEKSKPLADPVIEAYWVEDEILQHFFIGLKLELQVQELNIGVKFFDSIIGVYCSFHLALPNELVIEHWKEPLPNTRPPPTVDNPEAEETAIDMDLDRELEEDEKKFGTKPTKELPVAE